MSSESISEMRSRLEEEARILELLSINRDKQRSGESDVKYRERLLEQKKKTN